MRIFLSNGEQSRSVPGVAACCVIAAVLCNGCADDAAAPSFDSGVDASTMPDAPRYRRGVFAGVFAQDRATLVAWYRDTLGMNAKADVWFGLEDHSSLEIFEGGTASSTPKTPEQQSIVVGLQVPDLDAAADALEARGVVFTGAIEGEAGVDRWRYLADPEGNRLELKDIGAPRAGQLYEAIPWAGIYLEHFDETVAWYEDVLGLHKVASGGTNPRWAHFLLEEGGYVEMFSGGKARAPKKDAAHQAVAFGLLVDDLEHALEALKARGVEVEMSGGKEIQTWVTPGWPTEHGATVLDPEGNVLGLKQQDPP